jgi:hypothetical protein
MERYSRFGLDEIYGQYKENRARLNQLKDEASYQLEVEDSLGYYYELDEVYYKRRSNIRMLYEQNSMLWEEYQKTYKWLYGNFPNDFLLQQYGRDCSIENNQYGQWNYNQELEFDRHRMSYDSNLEQYDHEYYGQSNYNQELEFDRHRMFYEYDFNLERDEYP